MTGYTNTAVDNLAEGLRNRGLKVLRYGAKIRIRESLWPITLDGYIDGHRSQRSLNNLKLKTYAAEAGSGTPCEGYFMFSNPTDSPLYWTTDERTALSRKLFGLERHIMEDIAAGIDVVSRQKVGLSYKACD